MSMWQRVHTVVDNHCGREGWGWAAVWHTARGMRRQGECERSGGVVEESRLPQRQMCRQNPQHNSQGLRLLPLLLLLLWLHLGL